MLIAIHVATAWNYVQLKWIVGYGALKNVHHAMEN